MTEAQLKKEVKNNLRGLALGMKYQSRFYTAKSKANKRRCNAKSKRYLAQLNVTRVPRLSDHVLFEIIRIALLSQMSMEQGKYTNLILD